MATNKFWERGTPLQFVSPSAITSGSPAVMRGSGPQTRGGFPVGLAMVANADYQSINSVGLASYDLEGAFLLTVLAESAESPAVNSAVAVGDRIYANINTGTYDAATGIFYGFTLDKNQSGISFGTVVSGSVIAGSSGVVAVRLKEGD